jgi:hypothetical protein
MASDSLGCDLQSGHESLTILLFEHPITLFTHPTPFPALVPPVSNQRPVALTLLLRPTQTWIRQPRPPLISDNFQLHLYLPLSPNPPQTLSSSPFEEPSSSNAKQQQEPEAHRTQ